MNLTLVTETFPPEVNGVAMTLGRLTAGLQERGYKVDVVCPGRPEREGESALPVSLVEVSGIPIPRYPELRFGLPAGKRLGALWRAEPPKWVHIATEGPLGWSALRVAERMAIPVVSSFHTNFHSYGGHYGYGFLKPLVLGWLRRFHNRTLRTFAPSEDLLRQLHGEGFQNLRLMARGIDTRLFDPARRDRKLRSSWGAGPSTPVALYVGRLAREKNLELAIRAWQRMRQVIPDMPFVLVGDGPERERIRKSFPEIHLAGMQQGESLAAHYASADCFLFGSMTETFGNVVTEAMASGLPVLAFDYAAPARFIESGSNGFTVAFGDEAAFLEAAVSMARQHPVWPAMGRLARRRGLPESWDSVVDDYLSETAAILPNLILQTA